MFPVEGLDRRDHQRAYRERRRSSVMDHGGATRRSSFAKGALSSNAVDG
jgi:hypothetical protein